ncbi:MAG: adenylate/guanylate cyclase domain-containing protein [Pseudomonadota bacterium]
MERRLAAILAADAVGFSRLMGEDEAGTLTALKALHKELFAPKVAEHRGRIVKLMGDGALVEFASVVDAVNCALAVQRAIAARNQEPLRDKRIELRIAVNLGDVIFEGSDLYGDGVNVAARLQALAAPGGIVLSATAHEHAAPKLDAAFQDGGSQSLKNIAKPIRVFHWSDAARPAPAEKALTLPDKPSIAVMPFDNMSADGEQDYFSDGITEDIITELSRFSSLFVIARNSTFSYKGKAVELTQIARELGVHYLLEGSIRRAGQRVRLTAQLIDGESGSHLWAEKYDRELEDIFELQEEITGNVVASIAPQIEIAEMARAQAGKAARFQSYDLALKAQARFYDAVRMGRPELHKEALDLATEAVTQDSRCAHGLWILAFAQIEQYLLRWGDSPELVLERAWQATERLFEVDSSDTRAYTARGLIYFYRGAHDAAVADLRRGYELNPNHVTTIFTLAWCESLSGLTEEAKAHAALGLRLSPRENELWLCVAYLALAQACFAEGDYAETRKWAELAIQMHGRAPIRRTLMIACCAQAGSLEEAEGHAEFLASFSPDFASSLLRGELRIYKSADENSRLLDGLRKAGLSD